MYPGEFTDQHPSGEGEPVVSPLWQPYVTAGSNILPIHYLSHVTHDKQAEEIKQDEVSVFKAKAKWGKSLGKYDGFPVGETFKPVNEDKFEQIPFGEPVFPGQITWWGISMHEVEATEQGSKFKKAVKDVSEKTEAQYPPLPEYLKVPPRSRYGNNEFVIRFHDLMKSFKESRTDCGGDKDVYLKLGGTLRYKHEVCYVIIVAMAEDISDEYFKELPSVYNKSPFIHNGCIDKDGKIINEETPSFEINHIFSDNTWETLAFGFYFPEPHISLPKRQCTERTINHNTRICISTKPPAKYEKFVCPNEL